MARVNNLNDFLTDVAGAIKTKKGSETAIPAANFDTEILALPSQGTYEQKTLRVSTNGTQTVVPSSGFDAIDELELIVAVPGSTINNQDKTIIQNGTYAADSGYTGLGTVIVNVPQEGVKKFESVEQMQASTGNQEGDLAIVYNSQILPLTENSIFQTAIFPDTVVLDEAIPSGTYINGEFMNVEDEMAMDSGYCNLSSDDFSFSYYGDGSRSVDIQYTSNDGINYTRTDSVGNPVDFGVKLKFGSRWGSATWNNNLGYFIKVNQANFAGLYEYKQKSDKTRFQFLSINSPVYSTANDEITMNETPIGDVYTFEDISPIRTTMWNNGIKTNCAYIDNNDALCFVALTGQDHNSLNGYFYNNSGELTHLGSEGVSFTSVSIYTVDLVNKTYSLNRTINTEDVTTYNSGGTTTSRKGVPITSLNPKTMIMILNQNNMANLDYRCFSTKQYITITNATSSGYYYMKKIPYIYYAFDYASNQFTLKNASQLLNDITGFGANGAVTGDGTIWSNSDLSVMNQTLLGYNFDDLQTTSVISTQGKYNYNYGFLKIDSTSDNVLIVNYEDRRKLVSDLKTIASTRDSDWGNYANAFVHPKAYFLWSAYNNGSSSTKNYLMMCDEEGTILFYDKFASYTQTGLMFWGCNNDYAFFVANTGSSTDAVIRINLNTFEKDVKTVTLSSRGSSDYKYLPAGLLAKDGDNIYFCYGNTNLSNTTFANVIKKYNWTNNTVTSIKSTYRAVDSHFGNYCDVSGDKAIIVQARYGSSGKDAPFVILHDPTAGTSINISGIDTSSTIYVYGMYNSTLDKYYLFGYNSYFNAGAGFGIYEINTSTGTLTRVVNATMEQVGNTAFSTHECAGNYAYLYGNTDYWLKVDLSNNTFELKERNNSDIGGWSNVYSWINGHKVTSQAGLAMENSDGEVIYLRGDISNIPDVTKTQLVVFFNKDTSITDPNKLKIRLLNNAKDIQEIM